MQIDESSHQNLLLRDLYLSMFYQYNSDQRDSTNLT